MFTVYGGKCLSRKAIHNRVERFFQGRSKVEDDDLPGRPVRLQQKQLCSGRKSWFELTEG
jgi:hypothetical protein